MSDLYNNSNVQELTPADFSNKNGQLYIKNDTFKGKPALIKFYAPWCPHCHTAMPAVIDASLESEHAFAIVNSELIDPKTLQGDIFQVTHFPYICRQEKKNNETTMTVFKGSPTKEEILKFSKTDALEMLFA